MRFDFSSDLWDHLRASSKKIVLYGMGNGAEKVLDALAAKGLSAVGVFASEGFVREKIFHGMKVASWEQIKTEYGAENVVVLLSFGTSREDVLQNILRVAGEAELYAPDVPAFGDGLFDLVFLESHRKEIESTENLLADAESKRIFENVIRYKITGKIKYLFAAESDENEITELIAPERIKTYVDLGAYRGETVERMIGISGQRGGKITDVYALEPDPRNFRKLEEYAKRETRAKVTAVEAGAWSEETALRFDGSGNRNASFAGNRSGVLKANVKGENNVRAVTVDGILGGRKAEYIKYDVEGSEREALKGTEKTAERWRPTLAVAAYHRSGDIFELPMLLYEMGYREIYLRRRRGIPAWDLELYAKG